MAAHQAAYAPDQSDLWYVAIAPGETKLLSLEQLDDLFRLEIIDADTRLWQPGMREWLPLSVVAGLDADDDDAPTSIAPPPSARAPVQRAPSPPPRPVAVAPARRAPEPFATLPPGRPAPIAPQAINAWPQVVPSAQPNFSAFSSAPPVASSVRPRSYADMPLRRSSGSGAFGRFVIALALLAGAALTLYRNDFVREAALAARQEPLYAKLESALGGPSFGTPRAVAALGTLSAPTSTASPSSASANSSRSALDSGTAARAAAPSPAMPQSVTAPLAATPSGVAQAAPKSNEHASSNAASSAPVSLESRVAAPSPVRAAQHAASAVTPVSHAKPSTAPVARDIGIKGSSNKYDPLNGKL